MQDRLERIERQLGLLRLYAPEVPTSEPDRGYLFSRFPERPMRN